VNTRNNRASALGLGLAALVVLPAPDGTVDQPDKQHVSFCYAGISAQQLVTYDSMSLESVSLSSATLSGISLGAATLTNITLEAN